MARFDVHGLRDGSGFVLDCQSDLLRHLETRFVVPLMPQSHAPAPLIDRLNPQFLLDGEPVVMMTQFASSLYRAALGPAIASLSDQQFEIGRAVDILLGGV